MAFKPKTHRGAAKRFKKTGSGSIVQKASSSKRHKLAKKSAARKRRLAGIKPVSKADKKRIEKMLPNN